MKSGEEGWTARQRGWTRMSRERQEGKECKKKRKINVLKVIVSRNKDVDILMLHAIV